MRPHDHFAGSAPRRVPCSATVLRNEATITSRAFCAEPISVNAGLVGARKDHASRSWPSASLSSVRFSLTLCDFHHGSKVAARYSCQKVHHTDAAAELVSIL